MSFILDALKKIEGQKQKEGQAQADKLPVMEGGRRWGEPRHRFALTLGVVGVLALAALVLAAVALYVTYREDGSTAEAPEMPGRTGFTEPSTSGEPAVSTDETSITPARPAEAPLMPASSPLAEQPSAASEDADEIEPAEIEQIETAPPIRLAGPGAPQAETSLGESSGGEVSGDLPEGAPKLVLQGTSTVDGRPVAVVNFQRVFEGDFIEGVRVIHISDREVELEFEGKRFSLKL